MDPALLKERDAFRKKAIQLPTIEKRKINRNDDAARPSKKIKKDVPKFQPKREFDYKKMSGSSLNKFGVLAKIVKHMQMRHMQGSTHPLPIDEILDETNQLDITPRQKDWLIRESLPNNPKVELVDGDMYVFKPKFNIKDKNALRRLLDKHDQRGMGGILKDDIEESLPRAARAFKLLDDQILYITKPDKKQILFYNDKSFVFEVDEEIQKMWRSVAVEGVDERKIEDYLHKQGITSMQDIEVKKASQKKRKTGKRKTAYKTHNEHMGAVLQDYSSMGK